MSIFENVAFEEREFADYMHQSFKNLPRYAMEFMHAIQLFEFANTEHRKRLIAAQIRRDEISRTILDNGPKLKSLDFLPETAMYGDWKLFAAHEGAMLLYHFRKAIDEADLNRGKCPKLSKMINLKEFKTARAIFTTKFPSFLDIRDSVGHRAETHASPAERAKNSFSGRIQEIGLDMFAESLVISDHLNGNTYTCTMKGKICSYELDKASFETLQETILAVYSVFKMKLPD